MTRRYHFSASHRLHSGDLSEAENEDLYGKCNNPHGHGHNYVLEVTVAGQLDPVSGQLINLEALDEIVRESVLRQFDHRDLNSEIPEFAGVVPTSENLALAVAERLRGKFKGDSRLDAVRLQETKRNRFELNL